MENRKKNNSGDNLKKRLDLAKKVLNSLTLRYKDTKTDLKYSSPLELLIAIILSAQCTDKMVNKVTEKLFKRITNLEQYLDIDIIELERLIFSTGFYKNKAKNIKIATRQIKDLGHIPNKISELTKIAGVGRKTANVFLSEYHQIAEGIVIDTHIFRVTKRLGISYKNSPLTMERDLMGILDKKDWIKYSNLLIRYGREICSSRKPKCELCEFREDCRYFNKNI